MPSGRDAAFSPDGGHGGLGSRLDLNGDGNTLDDILAIAGQVLG